MRKFLFALTFLSVVPFGFLLVLIISLSIYNQNPQISYQRNVAYAALPTAQNAISATIIEDEGKVERIRQFMAKYKSGLEPYAADVVASAEQYGLDERLIVAIAMKESTLCKTIPEGSHNCWGFGIYGGKVTTFSDYREGIYIVSKALGTRYKDKHGLITPEDIMSMYTPSSDGSWARDVNHFMEQMK